MYSSSTSIAQQDATTMFKHLYSEMSAIMMYVERLRSLQYKFERPSVVDADTDNEPSFRLKIW